MSLFSHIPRLQSCLDTYPFTKNKKRSKHCFYKFSAMTPYTIYEMGTWIHRLLHQATAMTHDWLICLQQSIGTYNISIWYDNLSLELSLEADYYHYSHVIMGAMASQITSLMIVYSTICSDADQRKHQTSASLDFVRGIHRGQVNYPHKGPVTRQCFHLMTSSL